MLQCIVVWSHQDRMLICRQNIYYGTLYAYTPEVSSPSTALDNVASSLSDGFSGSTKCAPWDW